MLRRALLACLVAIGGVDTAVGQIAVTDTARTATERNIADCMTKARVFKQKQVTPQQNIKTSMATPGASGVPTAGAADVSGQGATAPSSGLVSGIDFSQVPMIAVGGGQGIGAINLNAAAQAVAGLTSVANAIKSNNGSSTAASVMMGALGLTQLAWNQNSGARTNTGLFWNQVIATASLTAALWNQRGLKMTAGASAGANALLFDPTLATFVGAMRSIDTNAIALSTQN